MPAVSTRLPPLALPALGLIAGTALALFLPLILQALAVLLSCAILAGFPVRRIRASGGLPVALFLLLGLVSAWLRSDALRLDPLARLEAGRKVYLEGEARLLNRPKADSFAGHEEKSYLEVDAELRRWTLHGKEWKGSRRVRIRDFAGNLQWANAGDRWLLRGPYRAGASYPSQGLWTLRDAGQECLDAGSGRSLRSLLSRHRQRCRDELEAKQEEYPVETEILQALLLGQRDGIPLQWKNRFAETGTLHVFAISGLHVGLMSLILIAGLRWLGLGPHRWIWGLTPLLIGYTLLTGAAPSAVRACVMALIFWSAPAVWRRPDPANALSLAALAMLLADPDQLKSIGFVFSFSVVWGLLLFAPPIYAWLRRNEDRRMESPTPQLFTLLRARVAQGLAASLAVSMAAWVVSAPLTALYFNRCSPIALLGNVVVAPMVFIILLLGFLSLGTLGWLPALGLWILRVNLEVIHVLLMFIEGLSRVPGGHSFVKAPAVLWIVLYYLLLLLLKFRRPRQFRRSLLFGSVVLMVSAGLRLLAPPALHALPAGKGMALLLDLPGSSDVLIDAGPRYRSGERLRELRRLGTDSIAVLLLTHPDAQHYGAVREWLDALPIQRVLVAPAKGSATYRALLADLEEQGCVPEVISAGWQEEWPGGMFAEALYPPVSEGVARADDGALILRISRGVRAALILGDASQKAQENLLQHGPSPGAHVLIASGGADVPEPNPAFLEAVNPEEIRWISGIPPSSFETGETREWGAQKPTAILGDEPVRFGK